MKDLFPYLKTQWILKKKLVLSTLNPVTRQVIRFVIISQSRAGSTLLHTYLNSHPHIMSRGELPRRLSETNSSRPFEKILPGQYSYPINSIGIKIFLDYYRETQFKSLFDWIISQKDILIILLTRSNLIRSYISLKIAEKTNLWSQTPTINRHNKRIHFDKHDFERYKAMVKKDVEVISDKIRNHQVYSVQYEQLVEKPQETLSEILSFLHVNNQRLFSLLEKQNPEPVSELVEDWEVIKNRFENNNLYSEL